MIGERRFGNPFRPSTSARHKKGSDLWIKAVDALKELCDESYDAARIAVAEALHQAIYDGISRRLSGRDGPPVKQSKAKVSIHRIAGVKLGHQYDLRPPRDDHPSLWTRDRKPYAYHSQPYGVDLDDLRKIVSFCDTHGLDLWIDAGYSNHYPLRTLSLMYTKKES